MAQISRAEPVTQLKKIKIVENGEPLVSFLDLHPRLVMDKPRFTYRRETVVRHSLAEKLIQAAEALPAGYLIAIVEGWRAPFIQERMYKMVWKMFKERNPTWSDSALRRVVNQFSAPMDLKVPPPHTTGAAVDLALLDTDGNSLEMSDPFDPHDPKGFFLHSPGLSDLSRKHRTILSEAVSGAGITNYPSEFWHYSYGDQGWAYRGGHPTAIYGAVTPVGWEPNPADLSDDPLVFIEA